MGGGTASRFAGSLEVVEDGEELSVLKFISSDAEESPSRILERSELERVIADGMKRSRRMRG